MVNVSQGSFQNRAQNLFLAVRFTEGLKQCSCGMRGLMESYPPRRVLVSFLPEREHPGKLDALLKCGQQQTWKTLLLTFENQRVKIWPPIQVNFSKPMVLEWMNVCVIIYYLLCYLFHFSPIQYASQHNFFFQFKNILF